MDIRFSLGRMVLLANYCPTVTNSLQLMYCVMILSDAFFLCVFMLLVEIFVLEKTNNFWVFLGWRMYVLNCYGVLLSACKNHYVKLIKFGHPDSLTCTV